ncbi:ankyrin repeat-containing protein [European chub iridovirus]|nr:ankyrin repeat-containing protein [European chub iridovirus]
MDKIADLIKGGSSANELKNYLQFLDVNDMQLGHSLLSIAVKHNNLAAVQLLLQRGADTSLDSPLLFAHNNREMFDYLIDLDYLAVNVQEQDTEYTLLHLAVIDSNLYEIEKLLSHYMIDVNVRDSDGRTPLFYATNNVDIIRLLSEANADVNVVDYNNESFFDMIVNVEPNNFNQNYKSNIVLPVFDILSSRLTMSADALAHLILTERIQPPMLEHVFTNVYHVDLKSYSFMQMDAVNLIINEALYWLLRNVVESLDYNLNIPQHKTAFNCFSEHFPNDAHQTMLLAIQLGLNMNVVDDEGDPPLMTAIFTYNIDSALWLVQHKLGYQTQYIDNLMYNTMMTENMQLVYNMARGLNFNFVRNNMLSSYLREKGVFDYDEMFVEEFIRTVTPLQGVSQISPYVMEWFVNTPLINVYRQYHTLENLAKSAVH